MTLKLQPNTLSTGTPDGAHTLQAAIHPETGNLRISVHQPGPGWAYFFFRNRAEAVEWLEEALDLVDPEGSEENS